MLAHHRELYQYVCTFMRVMVPVQTLLRLHPISSLNLVKFIHVPFRTTLELFIALCFIWVVIPPIRRYQALTLLSFSTYVWDLKYYQAALKAFALLVEY